jgi:hypothetical protein
MRSYRRLVWYREVKRSWATAVLYCVHLGKHKGKVLFPVLFEAFSVHFHEVIRGKPSIVNVHLPRRGL